MKTSTLSIVAAILLILYGLVNIAGGFGQFTKAKLVSGSGSLAADMGRMAGDNAGAARVEKQGVSVSAPIYFLAIMILGTAVLNFAAAAGIFSESNWAVKTVIAAAACGFIIELWSGSSSGFGVGRLIFFIINALALYVGLTAKKPEAATA